MSASAATMLSKFGPQDILHSNRQAIESIPVDPTDPPFEQDLDTDGGGTDANTNENASSSTPPSRDPPTYDVRIHI